MCSMTNPTTLIGEQLIEHIFPSPLLGAFKKNGMATVAGQNAPTNLSDFLSGKQTKNYTQHTQVFILGKALGFTLHKTQPLKWLLFMSMINMTETESVCLAC